MSITDTGILGPYTTLLYTIEEHLRKKIDRARWFYFDRNINILHKKCNNIRFVQQSRLIHFHLKKYKKPFTIHWRYPSRSHLTLVYILSV